MKQYGEVGRGELDRWPREARGQAGRSSESAIAAEAFMNNAGRPRKAGNAAAEGNVAPVAQSGRFYGVPKHHTCHPRNSPAVTSGSAQDLDRDRDQLKTQQQLQEKDKLQTKDQLHKDLKDKEQLHERERTRERERAREHMQTERPDKPQHEREERGERGGR